MKNKKLGRHLEWHGNRIRVVVRVPPSMTGIIGATKLRRSLTTTDVLEAEREKVDVVKDLRQQVARARVGVTSTDLTEQALRWRDAIAEDDDVSSGDLNEVTAREVLSDTVENISAEHGFAAGQEFAAIALGVATPVRSYLDRWFAEKDFSVGYVEDVKRAVTRLEEWCGSHRTPASIESVSKKVAASFIHDQFIVPRVDRTTANKTISCLMSYWRWLDSRYGFHQNPWRGQRVGKRKVRDVAEQAAKRPFTDDEVVALLNGNMPRRELDFSLIAALSGLRINEIGRLRVRDCANGNLRVTKSKTPSGVRAVPLNPTLMELIKRRSVGKRPEAYLFEDVPEQVAGSKRDRSAPVSQGVTMPNLSAGVMTSVPVKVPPLVLQQEYERLLEPIAALSASLLSVNQKLGSTRDLLLPRLISGELSVSKAERKLEAVA